MKTQITKTLMAIALLAAGFIASANENERAIELTTVNQKAVVLKMQDIEEGTRITLRNEAGELLFQDEAKDNVYGKVFNLQQMASGNLTLELENKESLEILSIEVTADEAKMNKSKSVFIAKPILKQKDGELKVYLGNKCLEMQMTIFDKFDDVVYRKDIEKGSAKVQRYDLSDLAEGKYTIQFSADGRSFYHTVSL